MRTYYIYILINPINDEVFYVGVTQNPKARLSGHRYSSSNTKKDAYVKNMVAKPEMFVIDEIKAACQSDVKNLEGYWISQFKTWGFPICNSFLATNRKDPNNRFWHIGTHTKGLSKGAIEYLKRA